MGPKSWLTWMDGSLEEVWCITWDCEGSNIFFWSSPCCWVTHVLRLVWWVGLQLGPEDDLFKYQPLLLADNFIAHPSIHPIDLIDGTILCSLKEEKSSGGVSAPGKEYCAPWLRPNLIPNIVNCESAPLFPHAIRTITWVNKCLFSDCNKLASLEATLVRNSADFK